MPAFGVIPQVKWPLWPLHTAWLRVMLIITRSPWSVGAVGSLVHRWAGGVRPLAQQHVRGRHGWAAPATYSIASFDGVSPAAPVRDGAGLAPAQWQGSGRGRGTQRPSPPGHKAVALSASAHWRSCGPLNLAAL